MRIDLTIEQMHRILNNAPDRAEMWRDMDSVCSPNEIFYYAWFGGALLVHSDGQWIKSIYHQGDEYILDQLQDLKDLRTAITEHEGSASGFEEYIVAKYPNRSAKVLTHRLEDVDGTMFYACKDVQDQFEAWNHQQSKIEHLTEMNKRYLGKMQEQQDQIAELKKDLFTYRIEAYEHCGRVNYAHQYFLSVNRDQFLKNIEAILCGRLRHPEFSFDKERIKALRGES